jgi:plasmid stabilization system protein ParE
MPRLIVADRAWEEVDDRWKEFRFWPVKKYTDYLVIYRPLNDGAEIVRVIHGARDMARMLSRP